jgi:16S rRNA U1498 N3-methylase RsmE
MSTGKLLTPRDLMQVTEQAEMAKARALAERLQKQAEQKDNLQHLFLEREIDPPDATQHVNAAVRHAAELGVHEIQILTFPANYCNDKGRRINNLEADWPESLEGFAKRAYAYYVQELQPLGYKVRAQVLDYPDGMPGEVGIFLSW